MLLASDRQLLQRFRAGDSQAMADVFVEYADQIARFVRSGFGIADTGELHDVVAETFRRAFEDSARLRYDGVGPYAAYLKTIARNLVLDRLRSPAERDRQRIGDAAGRDPLEVAADTMAAAAMPDMLYEDAELGALIGAFRDTLTSTERKLLALRYEQGQSQEQVAARLQRSRRWVRDTERDIRRRLLRHLEGTGYLAEE